MIYGYIRISTDKQTIENQRFEITKFCTEKNLQVDKWISETISGTKEVDKRRLGKLLKGVREGDIIICSEISRLGRTLFMIMSILNRCMEIGAKVWTVKDSYRLGDDITSKVLAFAFGISAEIERKLISQRTKEALARKKSEGMKLGRPKAPEKRNRYHWNRFQFTVTASTGESPSFPMPYPALRPMPKRLDFSCRMTSR